MWDKPCCNKNVLRLFVGERDSRYVSLYRAWHADRTKLGPFAYKSPEVINTDRGTVLHVNRFDNGAGMTLWFNHEYWLWQWGDWQRLDVTSWYKEVNSFVPSGYRVHGVSETHFDLPGMKNISPVAKHGDGNCCPTGGTVTIQFRWEDLSLAISDVTYDADTDFRSVAD